MTSRIIAYQITEYLEKMGIEIIFGLCGHTNIALLSALDQSTIRFITSRHEQIAAHMADGYARVSGRPAVLLTHLGPGLTNATTGVANASLDSIPLVVIAGDVPAHFFGRHPHQEINLHTDADQYEIYRPFTKRIWRVGRPSEFPRVMERAFHIAQSGRPGTVLVDVPMDVFSAELPDGSFSRYPPNEIGKPTIEEAIAKRVVMALAETERPILYVGGGILLSKASGELASLADWLDVPVLHTLMGKGAISDSNPLNAGMTGFWGVPVANDLALNADLIVAVGTRFGETDSSSWDPRFTFAIPPTRLIQIDIDPNELGRNFPTELAVVSDAKNALSVMLAIAKEYFPKGVQRSGLRELIKKGRGEFAQQWTNERISEQFPLKPDRILSDVRAVLPEDGYIVTDVGWNKNGVGQQFDITVPGTFITPGGLATMGFGPAAALGVKLAASDKQVLALVGDGAISSNMSVMATAAEANIPVVWVVMDNLAFGTIGLLEEHHFETSYGTKFIRNGKPYGVDYAAVARACGVEGIKISQANEFAPALEDALASEEPTLIQVPMENVPTPTPGHWDINDIYRKGS